MQQSRGAWSVLFAALSVHCGGNATDDTHQVDPTAPSSDAGAGRAGRSGAGGASGGGLAGGAPSEAGGTAGESGIIVAGGGTGATAGGGAAGDQGSGGALAEEVPDGSVIPTCKNQQIREGASCRGLNLSCGGGCHVCTCEALPSGGTAWKCYALVC